MRARPVVALILAAVAACGPSAGASDARAELLSVFEWKVADRPVGGLSAIHVSEDGTRATVLSDRGEVFTVVLARSGDAITGAEAAPSIPLLNESGQELTDREWDSEGLAIGPDGRLWVSFEGIGRVWGYAASGGRPDPLPRPREFNGLQANSGLEALAGDAEGTLYAIPERSGALDLPFPVFRYRDGAWSVPFEIPRRGGFLVVGADIGPDGRFYLLERQFHGIFGFSTRVRRFDLGAEGLTAETELFQTRAGTHDNLEGISVWRDAAGAIRILMVSDDNNLRLQTTELVEYRVTE